MLGETQTFAYDPLDRLRLATATGAHGYEQQFSYDPVGNITALDGLGYTYGDPAHVHAVTALSNGATFTYDANGNMTWRVENGVAHQQQFDVENRLVAVTTPTGTVTFTYNGDGERVLRIAAEGTTACIGDLYEVFYPAGGAGGMALGRGVGPLSLPPTPPPPDDPTPPPTPAPTPTPSPGLAVTKYYSLGGQRACPECNRRVAMRQGDVVYYLHGDHLGSTSLATNAGGGVVARWGYRPYGDTRSAICQRIAPTIARGGETIENKRGLATPCSRQVQ